MRTTLDLPAALMDEARKMLGFKSKTDTVILSLTELVRRRRIEELRGLLGHVDLDLDLDRSRRRPLAPPESPRPRRRRARA
jgi:Arc/MetJ family transcription regulator